jgi:hypothetical protein
MHPLLRGVDDLRLLGRSSALGSLDSLQRARLVGSPTTPERQC